MAEDAATTPGALHPAATAAGAIAAELKKLDATPAGRSSAEVASRLSRYGRNAIAAPTESR